MIKMAILFYFLLSFKFKNTNETTVGNSNIRGEMKEGRGRDNMRREEDVVYGSERSQNKVEIFETCRGLTSTNFCEECRVQSQSHAVAAEATERHQICHTQNYKVIKITF
jgi:hypothetical protein